jgi:putative ABC transport system substrate-binding protein
MLGYLAVASPESAAPQKAAFFEGLRDLGYVEGQNYEIVIKWGYSDIKRLPVLAKELVDLKPTLILANPTPAVLAVRALTDKIPIVSFMLGDELHLGLVASHARPGGNVTGLALRVEGMVGGQLEIATQTVREAKHIGVIFNGLNADAAAQRQEAETAAGKLGVKCTFVDVRTRGGIASAFERFESEGTKAAIVLFDALFFQERRAIAALAAGKKLPVVYGGRDHVDDGGLMSYGVSLRASSRRMAMYVDKILKGARPADLPIEFPTKLEVIISLRAANALGLSIPAAVLARADEIID